MASINREVTQYASYEYEQLADLLIVEYNRSNRGSYPLGSFIQLLKHNWGSAEDIIARLNRYTDLGEYKKILFEIPLEDMPMYLNHDEAGICWIARWRLKLGK